MSLIYHLGLGSNMGKRAMNLARAVRLLGRDGVEVLKASSAYETEPVDLPGQAWFLNQVLEVRSALDPLSLLRAAKSIEAEMKRVPTIPKGPRTIDIDILFAGGLIIDTPELVVPHPRLSRRNFVLVPLAEIAPGVVHPVLGRTIRELAAACDDPALVAPFGQAPGTNKKGRRPLSASAPSAPIRKFRNPCRE